MGKIELLSWFLEQDTRKYYRMQDIQRGLKDVMSARSVRAVVRRCHYGDELVRRSNEVPAVGGRRMVLVYEYKLNPSCINRVRVFCGLPIVWGSVVPKERKENINIPVRNGELSVSRGAP